MAFPVLNMFVDTTFAIANDCVQIELEALSQLLDFWLVDMPE